MQEPELPIQNWIFEAECIFVRWVAITIVANFGNGCIENSVSVRIQLEECYLDLLPPSSPKCTLHTFYIVYQKTAYGADL